MVAVLGMFIFAVGGSDKTLFVCGAVAALGALCATTRLIEPEEVPMSQAEDMKGESQPLTTNQPKTD